MGNSGKALAVRIHLTAATGVDFSSDFHLWRLLSSGIGLGQFKSVAINRLGRGLRRDLRECPSLLSSRVSSLSADNFTVLYQASNRKEAMTGTRFRGCVKLNLSFSPTFRSGSAAL